MKHTHMVKSKKSTKSLHPTIQYSSISNTVYPVELGGWRHQPLQLEVVVLHWQVLPVHPHHHEYLGPAGGLGLTAPVVQLLVGILSTEQIKTTLSAHFYNHATRRPELQYQTPGMNYPATRRLELSYYWNELSCHQEARSVILLEWIILPPGD